MKEAVAIVVQLLSHVLTEHTRLVCPSLSPWVCSNSCPLSHPTISSSVTCFSSHLKSFPASGSFPRSHVLASDGQSIGASASVLPMNIQGWFPLGLTGLISFLCKGLSRVFPAPQYKNVSSLVLSLLYGPTLTSIHDYWKNHSFDYTDLCQQSKRSYGNPQICSQVDRSVSALKTQDFKVASEVRALFLGLSLPTCGVWPTPGSSCWNWIILWNMHLVQITEELLVSSRRETL